jgi:hypothetical protein
MSAIDGTFYPTSGLICALDPNNLKSWPGTGTTLIDLTGNGNNVTVSGSGNFANYNGQNVLRIVAGSYLTVSNLNLTLPYTVLGVDRYNGLGGNNRGRTISSNTTNWLMNHWSNQRYPYYANGWVGTNYITEANNTWEIGIVTGQSGDYHCYYDNIDKTTAPTGGTTGPGTFQFSGFAGANEPSDCDIGLFLVWNRVLSTQEISAVYTGARLRFGQ